MPTSRASWVRPPVPAFLPADLRKLNYTTFTEWADPTKHFGNSPKAEGLWLDRDFGRKWSEPMCSQDIYLFFGEPGKLKISRGVM